MSNSDSEQTTAQQVQDAIHHYHPFGLKIWKPALYPKQRSIDYKTYSTLHSIPGSVHSISLGLQLGNLVWAFTFGFLLFLVYLAVAICLFPLYIVGVALHMLLTRNGTANVSLQSNSLMGRIVNDFLSLGDYIAVLVNLSWYVLYPFGKFIAKKKAASTLFEASSPAENTPMLQEPLFADDFVPNRHREPDLWSEYSIERGVPYPSWIYEAFHFCKEAGFARLAFSLLAVCILAPIHFVISSICFLCIFPLPMAKLNYYLIRHLLKHPLQLSAHSAVYFQPESTNDTENTSSASTSRPRSIFFWGPATSRGVFADVAESPNMHPDAGMANLHADSDAALEEGLGNARIHARNYQIVLCTYRAAGYEFTKYTIDGVNIIFINLLSMIAFTLLDFYLIGPSNGYTGIAHKGFIFVSSILSTVPLAYFIGMAVSSVTAQTGSIALGSVINATFGSIIEIILYAIALLEGKKDLVDGAIIGSFLLGLLALPGVSMFFGGLRRKEQRFNAKSAGVTSTMLLVASIGVFTPTLFQNVYGSVEIKCSKCPELDRNNVSVLESLQKLELACKRCTISAPDTSTDPIYQSSTKPLIYICASILILTYAIGLWFTLRTHAHRIYPKKQKKHRQQMESPLISPNVSDGIRKRNLRFSNRLRPFSDGVTLGPPAMSLSAGANPESSNLNYYATNQEISGNRNQKQQQSDETSIPSIESEDGSHGHSDPGWSLLKSGMILLGCTVAYSMIAEILIDTLDLVLESIPSIGEKTLDNAISFAVNGNIALSLEIGSAYAIQVALLQIPALVAFSAFWNAYGYGLLTPDKLGGAAIVIEGIHKKLNFREFSLVFPQWDFYAVLFSVFLCKLNDTVTYVYLEGTSHYFKGAILLLSYTVIIAAFILAP